MDREELDSLTFKALNGDPVAKFILEQLKDKKDDGEVDVLYEEEEDPCPFIEDTDKYDDFTDEEDLELSQKALRGDMAALAQVGKLIVDIGIPACFYQELLWVVHDENEECDSLYNEGTDLQYDNHHAAAIEKFLEPAYHGYTDAMLRLGDCYYNYWNWGVEEGDEDMGWSDEYCLANSFRWFFMAACNGSVEAQFKVGEAYYYGRVPNTEGEMDWQENYPAAAYWFSEAGDCHADACNFLGTMYADGYVGDKVDHVKAFEYYKKSAEMSDYSLGWFNMGLSYENGEGVEQNYAKAMECYAHVMDSNRGAFVRYAIVEYKRYSNNPAMQMDAIRRLKEAARKGDWKAKEVLDELGVKY